MPSNPHRSGLPAIQKLKKLTAVLTLCFCGAVTQFASPQSQSTARPVPPTNPGGFRRPNPSNALPACGEELLQGSLGVRKVAVEEGPRPGAADPMAIPAGRYQLFPDDGIASFDPVGNKIQALYYTTDTTPKIGLGSSVSLQEQAWDPNGYGPTPIFSVSYNIVYNTMNVGTMSNSPVQQGSISCSQNQTVAYNLQDVVDVGRLINEFAEHIDELHLDARHKQKADAQIATIKAQLTDEPDPIIIKQAGRTLRNITEGAIGIPIATAAQPTVWTWVYEIMCKLFG